MLTEKSSKVDSYSEEEATATAVLVEEGT